MLEVWAGRTYNPALLLIRAIVLTIAICGLKMEVGVVGENKPV
jgi:hypothetical protein